MKIPKIDGKIIMSAIIAGMMLTVGLYDSIQPLPSLAQSKQSKPTRGNQQPKDPNLFEFLLRLLKPKSANGFSRGESCLLGDSKFQKSRLSPVWNPNIRVIGAWAFTELSLRSSDSRLDLWQGKLATIATSTGQTLALKQPVAVQTFILKDTPVFKLGKSYDLIFNPNELNNKMLSIQMVSSQDSNQISSELKALERSLNANKTKPDEVLLKKAEYFAQKGLQLDSWQAAYDASQLNPQLQSDFINLVTEICLPKSTASNP